MSIELQLLVCAVALTVIQVVVAATGASIQLGAATLAGNREGLADVTGWAGRAQRAHRNMLENLVLFAALVLVAHAAGRENNMTALGAQVFLWARAAYAVVYILGVPWLRTAIFGVSVVGLVMIFLQVI